MDPNLTDRQREILDFIRSYHAEHEYFPSLREIAGNFEVSIETVQTHLDYLKRKGALDWDKGKPRALRIGGSFKTQAADTGVDRGLLAQLRDLIQVPILGMVSAGPGLLAAENVEDTLTLPRNFLRYGTGEVFGLKVKGDSMIGAGILEGDLVMVRQQRTALPGEIVVALLGEEATVKYFQRRPDGIFLVSANPAYPPRKVGEDFAILGRVISLLRQY
ncbi:MAG: transcriptional repressor LexA [bacterium]